MRGELDRRRPARQSQATPRHAERRAFGHALGSSGAPRVHIRIKRLSIDATVAGASAVDPADVQAALQRALAERLGEGGGGRMAAREQLASVIPIDQTVADAVASHVRPFLGLAERR